MNGGPTGYSVLNAGEAGTVIRGLPRPGSRCGPHLAAGRRPTLLTPRPATRAIDLHQGDRLDEAALRDLIRAAVELERKPSKPKSRSKR
jgi:hypothetical protein